MEVKPCVREDLLLDGCYLLVEKGYGTSTDFALPVMVEIAVNSCFRISVNSGYKPYGLVPTVFDKWIYIYICLDVVSRN